eukprot:TRINITY_DN1741_c0_g1_i1.p1 TRINITY_DN1741_c0_g1~~TRINITY_DN1741_c0_g1_i1.p1  ORF type:complete len:1964 (-),score=407.98 TRINITY_DN1741_c0_g1_i1:81-5972(-)
MNLIIYCLVVLFDIIICYNIIDIQPVSRDNIIYEPLTLYNITVFRGNTLKSVEFELPATKNPSFSHITFGYLELNGDNYVEELFDVYTISDQGTLGVNWSNYTFNINVSVDSFILLFKPNATFSFNILLLEITQSDVIVDEYLTIANDDYGFVPFLSGGFGKPGDHYLDTKIHLELKRSIATVFSNCFCLNTTNLTNYMVDSFAKTHTLISFIEIDTIYSFYLDSTESKHCIFVVKVDSLLTEELQKDTIEYLSLDVMRKSFILKLDVDTKVLVRMFLLQGEFRVSYFETICLDELILTDYPPIVTQNYMAPIMFDSRFCSNILFKDTGIYKFFNNKNYAPFLLESNEIVRIDNEIGKLLMVYLIKPDNINEIRFWTEENVDEYVSIFNPSAMSFCFNFSMWIEAIDEDVASKIWIQEINSPKEVMVFNAEDNQGFFIEDEHFIDFSSSVITDLAVPEYLNINSSCFYEIEVENNKINLTFEINNGNKVDYDVGYDISIFPNFDHIFSGCFEFYNEVGQLLSVFCKSAKTTMNQKVINFSINGKTTEKEFHVRSMKIFGKFCLLIQKTNFSLLNNEDIKYVDILKLVQEETFKPWVFPSSEILSGYSLHEVPNHKLENVSFENNYMLYENLYLKIDLTHYNYQTNVENFSLILLGDRNENYSLIFQQELTHIFEPLKFNLKYEIINTLGHFQDQIEFTEQKTYQSKHNIVTPSIINFSIDPTIKAFNSRVIFLNIVLAKTINVSSSENEKIIDLKPNVAYDFSSSEKHNLKLNLSLISNAHDYSFLNLTFTIPVMYMQHVYMKYENNDACDWELLSINPSSNNNFQASYQLEHPTQVTALLSGSFFDQSFLFFNYIPISLKDDEVFTPFTYFLSKYWSDDKSVEEFPLGNFRRFHFMINNLDAKPMKLFTSDEMHKLFVKKFGSANSYWYYTDVLISFMSDTQNSKLFISDSSLDTTNSHYKSKTNAFYRINPIFGCIYALGHHSNIQIIPIHDDKLNFQNMVRSLESKGPHILLNDFDPVIIQGIPQDVVLTFDLSSPSYVYIKHIVTEQTSHFLIEKLMADKMHYETVYVTSEIEGYTEKIKQYSDNERDLLHVLFLASGSYRFTLLEVKGNFDKVILKQTVVFDIDADLVCPGNIVVDDGCYKVDYVYAPINCLALSRCVKITEEKNEILEYSFDVNSSGFEVLYLDERYIHRIKFDNAQVAVFLLVLNVVADFYHENTFIDVYYKDKSSVRYYINGVTYLRFNFNYKKIPTHIEIPGYSSIKTVRYIGRKAQITTGSLFQSNGIFSLYETKISSFGFIFLCDSEFFDACSNITREHFFSSNYFDDEIDHKMIAFSDYSMLQFSLNDCGIDNGGDTIGTKIKSYDDTSYCYYKIKTDFGQSVFWDISFDLSLLSSDHISTIIISEEDSKNYFYTRSQSIFVVNSTYIIFRLVFSENQEDQRLYLYFQRRIMKKTIDLYGSLRYNSLWIFEGVDVDLTFSFKNVSKLVLVDFSLFTQNHADILEPTLILTTNVNEYGRYPFISIFHHMMYMFSDNYSKLKIIDLKHTSNSALFISAKNVSNVDIIDECFGVNTSLTFDKESLFCMKLIKEHSFFEVSVIVDFDQPLYELIYLSNGIDDFEFEIFNNYALFELYFSSSHHYVMMKDSLLTLGKRKHESVNFLIKPYENETKQYFNTNYDNFDQNLVVYSNITTYITLKDTFFFVVSPNCNNIFKKLASFTILNSSSYIFFTSSLKHQFYTSFLTADGGNITQDNSLILPIPDRLEIDIMEYSTDFLLLNVVVREGKNLSISLTIDYVTYVSSINLQGSKSKKFYYLFPPMTNNGISKYSLNINCFACDSFIQKLGNINDDLILDAETHYYFKNANNLPVCKIDKTYNCCIYQTTPPSVKSIIDYLFDGWGWIVVVFVSFVLVVFFYVKSRVKSDDMYEEKQMSVIPILNNESEVFDIVDDPNGFVEDELFIQ